MQTITVQQLAENNHRHPVNLIDVRTRHEFAALHASPAKNIPIGELNPKEIMLSHAGSPDDQPLYLICKSGTRSSKAIRKFADAGYDNTINVIGGTNAWHAAGLPIEQNKQVISLERQVRIAAGIVTLLGILLANLIHPYCMVLTIFVGTGLIYAGVTENCGMGMLLSKMPWNQVSCG